MSLRRDQTLHTHMHMHMHLYHLWNGYRFQWTFCFEVWERETDVGRCGPSLGAEFSFISAKTPDYGSVTAPEQTAWQHVPSDLPMGCRPSSGRIEHNMFAERRWRTGPERAGEFGVWPVICHWSLAQWRLSRGTPHCQSGPDHHTGDKVKPCETMWNNELQRYEYRTTSGVNFRSVATPASFFFNGLDCKWRAKAAEGGTGLQSEQQVNLCIHMLAVHGC